MKKEYFAHSLKDKKKFIAHCREKDGEMQGIAEHLREVSNKAGNFALKIGLKEQGELIGLLHDFGKASREFQQYIKSATGLIDFDEDEYVDATELKGKVDHSTAGAQLIYRKIAHIGNEAKFVAQVLSLCIASHHSGLIDCISPEGEDLFNNRIRKAEEKTHVGEVFEMLNENDKELIVNAIQSKKLVRNLVDKFKELKTANDSKETLSFKMGLLVRLLYSCLIDSDRLNTADFEHPRIANLRNNKNYENWPVLIERLNNKLKSFKSTDINVVRQKISQACYDFSSKPKGRVYQLSVPTGGGKTFASLRFALNHAHKHKMDRIIYVMPYTTIIDQNADEMRKVLEEKDKEGNYLNKVVLEHHSNLMPDKETARQKVLSENWDAPVVLTTSVQILEALFGSGTRGARRMHQLANAVIIFDEVQAMPIKCVHMFNVAVNFLVNNCDSTVVLCTATQPLLDKVEPKSRALSITTEQQMIPNAKALFADLKRVETYDKRRLGGWINAEIKALVEQNIDEMGSVLVVVNTKKSAQEIYNQCKHIINSKIYHLSTHMCPIHRLAVLNSVKHCLADKEKVVCVSTQLIEAGVDISFGAVIRFLAGLDSIAQAAGRCNRHNEYPALGKVLIINSADENIEALEDIKTGKEKSERILDELKNNQEKFYGDILSAGAMEQYYKYYFFQRKDEMNYPVNKNSAVGRADNLFNLLSSNTFSVEEYKRVNRGNSPEIPIRQAFMTASKSFQVIEAASRGIVVPYQEIGKEIINKLCSAKELKKQYQLLRLARRYSVNVFPNVLEKLRKQGAVHEAQEGSGILCLDEQYYSEEFGLSETPVKDAKFLNA